VKLSKQPKAFNIKAILLGVALVIGIATLLYTNRLISQLQKKERDIVQLYAKGIEYLINSPNDASDLTFLFENVIQPIDFPIILTDASDNVNTLAPQDVKNLTYDTTMSSDRVKQFFAQTIQEMDENNPPILVTFVQGTDTIIVQKIHYGDSELINQLKYYPYIQLLIAGLFIITGYIGFSQIKKSEQSNLLVGMAKETAHQFGTPLSSLMGWIELLKMNYNDPDKVLDTANEIQNDVAKLTKVTNRFSKIGSKGELKPESVYEHIVKVTEYFNRRLPQMRKKVILSIVGDQSAKAMMNADLFEWVIENLTKNAIDAIEHDQGKIDYYINTVGNNVEIEVSDNGKGIDLKHRNDIFRPGYSTKRRGWGLGLSLTKRIVHEYHQGKIILKNSVPGEGSTFKITLKLADSTDKKTS